MSTLTQCRLRSVDGTGGHVVSWIPTKAAKVGTSMTLDEFGDELRWVVEDTFDTMDEAYIRERGRDYRTQRRASDV